MPSTQGSYYQNYQKIHKQAATTKSTRSCTITRPTDSVCYWAGCTVACCSKVAVQVEVIFYVYCSVPAA